MQYQFVDCRWEIGTPGRGRELYLAGHIPGASFLDVDDDLSSPPGHMLPWSHWSRPHGPDARVQQITHNLLQRALRGK